MGRGARGARSRAPSSWGLPGSGGSLAAAAPGPSRPWGAPGPCSRRPCGAAARRGERGVAPGGSEGHSGVATGVEVMGPAVAPREEPGPARCIPAVPSRWAFCREESGPSCVHTPSPALPSPPPPEPAGRGRDSASQWFNANGPGGYTGRGGGQPRGGSPAAGHAGRGEPTPSGGWRGDRGRPPPPAPGAAPSRFQQLVLVSQIQLSPTSTRSSAESPGDVTETLGDVLGRKPGRDGRSATAGLCPEKGSTTLPQSDRGLTREAPRAEAKPCSMQL